MEFIVKKYSKVKELTYDIKCALNSYNDKVMFYLFNKRLTRDELVELLLEYDREVYGNLLADMIK